jgi:hypothetical protein
VSDSFYVERGPGMKDRSIEVMEHQSGKMGFWVSSHGDMTAIFLDESEVEELANYLDSWLIGKRLDRMTPDERDLEIIQ